MRQEKANSGLGKLTVQYLGIDNMNADCRICTKTKQVKKEGTITLDI